MRLAVLLRLYPRSWRERYGEELAALIDDQGPSAVDTRVDLIRGALAAHFHPLAANPSATRSLTMNTRSAIARLAVVWGPLVALAIGTAMVLIDFWFGHGRYWSVDTFCADEVAGWRRCGSATFYFDNLRSQELYDLALHLATLAVAFAAALILAAVARRITSPSRTA
jgi:hypothetical protein